MAATRFVERLTPLDLTMPGGYVGALLVFSTTQQLPFLLAKLQKGLNDVCEHIPWLMGHIHPTPTTERQQSRLEIHWTATDKAPRIVEKGFLLHTYEELSRSQMPLESIPADMWISPSTMQVEPGSGYPVFAANLFRFADGKAVGLCVQMHHNAVDGFGFAEILRFWARCMNESSESSISIFGSSSDRNRRLANALGESPATDPSLDELFGRHQEYSRYPPILPTDFSACTSKILSIAMKTIDGWKERVRLYLATTPSTNTIACVLLWSAITRARICRNPDLKNKASRLPMAVNGRRRLGENLADPQSPYLGNLVLFSLAEMAVRDVSDCGQDIDGYSPELFADACRIIAQAQSPERINAAYIREVCKIMEGVEDYRDIFPGWELFGSRDLFITSWADLDIYEFDFGHGLENPQFVRVPYAQADGNVIVLPRKRNGAGERLEAVVMLQSVDLEELKKDGLWEVL